MARVQISLINDGDDSAMTLESNGEFLSVNLDSPTTCVTLDLSGGSVTLHSGTVTAPPSPAPADLLPAEVEAPTPGADPVNEAEPPITD